MSESSSTQGPNVSHARGPRTANLEVIDVRVKGNKMHAHESCLDADQAGSDESAAQSSMSSRKETNQIISFRRPHVRRVVPKERPRSSSSSSGSSGESQTDSDQDLLPDVYAKFDPQPHDNDSSDYGGDDGGEEPQDEVDIINTVEDDEPDGESLVDASSMPYEKSVGDPGMLTGPMNRKHYAKLSDKKSIRTAYPKIEGQLVKLDQPNGQGSKRQGTRKKAKKAAKIDFYEQGKTHEGQDEDVAQMPQPEIMPKPARQKPTKLPVVPAMRMQLLSMETELTTQSEVKQAVVQPTGKNKNKKSKKQR